MDSAEQVALAQRLASILAAGGVVIEAHHQEDGRGTYRPADMVNVIGWLAKGQLFVRPIATGDAPVMRPRLVK